MKQNLSLIILVWMSSCMLASERSSSSAVLAPAEPSLNELCAQLQAANILLAQNEETEEACKKKLAEAQEARHASESQFSRIGINLQSRLDPERDRLKSLKSHIEYLQTVIETLNQVKEGNEKAQKLLAEKRAELHVITTQRRNKKLSVKTAHETLRANGFSLLLGKAPSPMEEEPDTSISFNKRDLEVVIE